MRLPDIVARCLAFILLLFPTVAAYAQMNGFYVVASKTKLSQVVTVAKSGGDFTSIQAAADSITDASSSKRYVIVVGPGSYEGPVTLRDYVSLEGSGEVSTILWAKGSYVALESFTLKIGNFSNVSSLRLQSDGAKTYAIGLLCDGIGQVINDVTVSVTGSSIGYGVFLQDGNPFPASEHPLLRDATVTVEGTTQAFGIYTYQSSPTMVNVAASGTDGAGNCCGLYAASESYPKGFQCRFKGSTSAADHAPGSNITLANSMLDGGRGGTNYSCVQCFNGSMVLLGAQCQ